ncbi:MAG: YidC/Oxa1 family membrane protein insertase [Clostridia bacterium]|nr:YidC/Oxa1 family membrane protein insertase [Clostridia bacterium]
MFNLLATAQTTLGYGVSPIQNIGLNFIGEWIRILIDGIGITGLGIIVFTVILKTFVLPLDIFSRIKGKKQALIMERMRPQMEKLQKQYANDKNMYQQKVMELQKKSGYSMFSACLPMIVSLVIFIVVFSAFSTFSQYANLRSYNNMVERYNEVVNAYVVEPTDQYGVRLKDEDGNPITNSDGFLYEIILNDADNMPSQENGVLAKKDYEVRYDLFAARYNKDKGTSLDENHVFLALAEEYKKDHTGHDGKFNIQVVVETPEGGLSSAGYTVRNTLVGYYLEKPAAQRVKDYYEGKGEWEGKAHTDGFLWVKNIWYPDSTLNKELPDFAKFKSTVTKATITDSDQASYEKVTAGLSAQQSADNGYYILIIISIGLMVLQQFVSMRANKSVNELSTVDGSGKQTNKMMMIMMPIIYGVLSFFYSASFSLYMIVNTTYSLISMLIINKCVEVWFKKKEERGELDAYLAKKPKRKKLKVK